MRPPRAIFVFGYTQEDGVSCDLFPQATDLWRAHRFSPQEPRVINARFTKDRSRLPHQKRLSSELCIVVVGFLVTLSRAGHQPSRRMTPLHQTPAANPDPERLDETSVKTIQTKVNNKLDDPAVPVRTHNCCA